MANPYHAVYISVRPKSPYLCEWTENGANPMVANSWCHRPATVRTVLNRDLTKYSFLCEIHAPGGIDDDYNK